MVRAIACIATAVLLSIPAPARVSAQNEPGTSVGATFAVDFGAFSPMTTFQDDMFGESSFETAMSIGFSGTAWFHENFGIRFKVVRSDTNGTNELSEFAPLAVQDPTQWSFSSELTARRVMVEGGAFTVVPYVGLGAGMRHYGWEAARHDESKFFLLTGVLGADIFPDALGRVGLTAEVRGYRSQFDEFGIDGGNWRPGVAARPVPDEVGPDIGFYGGEVDSIWSNDLLFSVGVSYTY